MLRDVVAMEVIYVERAVRKHPRVIKLMKRFHRAEVIECERFGEVFNRSSQNFRLQKQNPSLILAEKHGRLVLPAPEGYSIGASRNYYFSHMLNCLYDCRYCFLQGMYRSASYVHFVNFEDFEEAIDAHQSDPGKPDCFFSGYDCDSLAMERITGFAERFVPFFSERPDKWLELRTKSINTSVLSRQEPVPNIVVAFTMTPATIAAEIEHGAPSFAKRLDRIESLTRQGWKIGLRLDPLIPWPGFRKIYPSMIEEIFSRVDGEFIHSVTLGPMRFPKAMYDRIVRLYPFDPLFALDEMVSRDGQMTYPKETENELVSLVEEELLRHLSKELIFRQLE
jgi:spore photoproduct lyase|tara:strand:+ start:20138 stop:21148 length:1011 start_codon:yes stop_codon:yes gene_type:complete